LANTRPNTARVVEKAIAVLGCLAGDTEELGVSDLSRRLGIGKSTVHRLLSTLMQDDLVRLNPRTRKYRLGFGVLRFSNALLEQFDIRSEALPHLRNLRDATGETASLVIRQDVERIHLEQVKGVHEVAFSLDVGSRVPLFVGASGKALTAWLGDDELDELIGRVDLPAYTPWSITSPDALRHELAVTRSRGFAVGVAERFDDVVSVAAPVRGYSGGVIAALNVAGPSTRLDLDRALELGTLVAAQAGGLSGVLGYSTRAG
jgi:DNA-binding IclR family transcriptional regulator